MEKTTFDVRLGGEFKVEASAERVRSAELTRTLYKSLTDDHHTFKPGDIVTHKDYMCLTKTKGPMVILEILDTPIIPVRDDDENPTSPYVGRSLDVRAIHVSDGHAYAHLYETRRFRPATDEELATEEGQTIQKFAEELMNPMQFQHGDIVMTKTGCDVRRGLDLMFFVGYVGNPIRNTKCSGGANYDGEIYDAHVCVFDGEDYQDICIPSWTLKLWDGSDAHKEKECNCISCRTRRAEDSDHESMDCNPLMSMLAAGLGGRN